MLYEIMRSIRNYFPVEGGYHDGVFEIKEGTINLPFLKDGQYFLIENSVFNDGVYQYPVYALEDETFEGTITALKPDRRFLELVKEIEEWEKKYKDKATSPFISESLQGVYSYTKSTSSQGNAGVITWRQAFGERLKPWRKI